MEIKGVNIGDQFMVPGKAKKLETVTCFIERKNMLTGEVIGCECWASHEFLGQIITREVPFTTVLIHRIKSNHPVS